MKANDARDQTKLLESQFLKAAEGSLQKLSGRLQKVLLNTILECPNKKCFDDKLRNIVEVNKSANGMLQLLGNQIQECISRQYNFQGMTGYNKCFLMFSRVLEWETRADFEADPSIRKGMLDSQASKEYHRNKARLFNSTRP